MKRGRGTKYPYKCPYNNTVDLNKSFHISFFNGIEHIPTLLENNIEKDRPILGYCKSGVLISLWTVTYQSLTSQFFLRTFTNHKTTREGQGISLTAHYHFHPLQRHFDIS